MTVIIQQGKHKMIAMPGAFIGVSDEENEKIIQAQRDYYKNRPDMIRHTLTQEEQKDIVENFLENMEIE